MIQRQDYPTYVYLHSNMVMTNWDQQDILTYRGDKNVYVEKNNKTAEEVEAEIAAYYEITEEQHFEYERQREEAEHPEMTDENAQE